MTDPQTPIIEAAEITVAFKGTERPAVRDVDVAVVPGDALGIVGETGSGKTTLGRVLVGATLPTEGTVAVRGKPWAEVKHDDPRRRAVQMVFQDPYGALHPMMTPRQAVREAVRYGSDRPSKAVADRAAEDLLHRVGLQGSALDARPRRLSGGQRQRVVIARALACEPEVLVADEPTSALDVSVQAQILNLLLDLKRERDLALVTITHDLAVLKHVSDRAAVMYQGEMVEQGSTEAILDEPQHEFTRRLVASEA